MKRTLWSLIPILLMAVLSSGDRTTPAAQTPHEHGGAFASCAKACAECMNSCASCYHHCASLVTEGHKDHAKTMTLCNDCAEVSSTAAKLTSRHSPFAGVICEACAKTCDDCAAACGAFPDDQHMAACAKACRECAAACREMIHHTSG